MRSLRRHHDRRMKQRAKDVLKRSWYLTEPSDRIIAKHADNLAICSCSMCGNPRKAYKGKNKNSLTIDEISALRDDRNMLICD